MSLKNGDMTSRGTSRAETGEYIMKKYQKKRPDDVSENLQKSTEKKEPRKIRKVEPIRDKAVIRDTLEALSRDRSPAGERRYLLFASGIYLGRRVGDLLKLTVGDVKGKKNLAIVEEKTGKTASMAINETLQAIYRERLKDRDPSEPLFVSTRAKPITGDLKAINKRTALRDIKQVARIARLPDDYRIGTHSMRKTFGYWYYKTYGDLATLMTMFNHSKAEVTLIYIGITDDQLRMAFRKTKDLYDD